MIVYSINPIDWWNGWQVPSDLFRVSVREMEVEWHEPAEWVKMWARARELAEKIGWEGDIREGPYVTVLPQPYEVPPVVIGWKQDNNGTTFIASPFELPWLAAEAHGRVEGG